MTTCSSLSLRHSMPSDASSGPPAFAASAVYSATLVEIYVRHEELGVRSLKHHHPDIGIGLHRADQANQIAHQFRSDQIHRRRVDGHGDHPLIVVIDVQGWIWLDHGASSPQPTIGAGARPA